MSSWTDTMTGMSTEEQLATERVREQLGLTQLRTRQEFAANDHDRHYATAALHQRLQELGEHYVHALVQLDLEIGSDLEIGGLEDDPDQAEYVRGLVAARRIIRGEL